jgi:uncharacterized repeat protein (TIGR01451 family)
LLVGGLASAAFGSAGLTLAEAPGFIPETTKAPHPIQIVDVPDPVCPGPDRFGGVCTSVSRSFVTGTTDIGNHCDDCTTAITLPFTFSFYGSNYTTANVSSNGAIEFVSNDIGFVSQALPFPSFNQTIFAWFEDLRTDNNNGSGNGIFTTTTGSSPNRTFVIEWRATLFGHDSSTVINFEAQLDETTNNVVLVYGNSASATTVPTSNPSCTGVTTSANGACALSAVQWGTGSGACGTYLQYSFNQPSLTNGLAVQFNTGNGAGSAADMTISSTHSGTWTQGSTGKTYTLTVGNCGAATSSGTVTVADTLPSGLTATAISGTGWTCTLATVSCTRSDALAVGSNYPDITLTVSVAANASASLSNSVTVSGGGETNTGNDTQTDATTITQVADMVVTSSHSGTFLNGDTGDTYTLTATNNGSGASSGTVTVVDTLPAGLTATAISGTGWNCTLATLTCTRSDALAAAASYPTITVTVNVAGNASSGNNSVTISGGGEVTTSNDTATDATTIGSASASFTPTSAQPGDTITGSGSGFTHGGTITVTINTTPSSTTLGTCSADSSGNLSGCSITLPLSLGAGSYTITLSDTSGHTATTSFTVASPPPPQSVVGKAGTSFTLKGGNFDKSTVPSVVFTPVNGGSATTVSTACASGQKIGCIQKTSTTSIAVKAPSGPSGLQKVTVSGVDVLTFNLYFDYGPAIQSISKASGDPGAPIMIKGGNFGTSKTSVPTITFGTSTINAKCGKTLKTGCITAASDKSISFKTPSTGSGANTIKVTTVGGSAADDLTRLGAAFTYDGAITNVKPAVGAGGSTVQIQGVNFGKASLTVAFGSTTLASSCSSGATGCIKTHSDTSITVIAPTGLTGSQDITVTNDEGNTADDRTITGASFDYNPAITAISPQAGPAAKTTIKLSGANFTKSLPTVTIGTSTISAKCGKTLKTGCFTSNNDKSVSIKPPTTLTGLQTISMTVGGVTADNLTGGDLVFDFGAAITTEK